MEQVRIYRNPVVRVPIPSDWIREVEMFSKGHCERKGDFTFQRWIETWYLSTKAVMFYYCDNWEDRWKSIVERVTRTGWAIHEPMTRGSNKYYIASSVTHEKFGYGPTFSARCSTKMFERSKATIFLLVALDLPDVDIVGWMTKGEVAKQKQARGYILSEPVTNPMTECPGLASKDNKKWYM